MGPHGGNWRDCGEGQRARGGGVGGDAFTSGVGARAGGCLATGVTVARDGLAGRVDGTPSDEGGEGAVGSFGLSDRRATAAARGLGGTRAGGGDEGAACVRVGGASDGTITAEAACGGDLEGGDLGGGDLGGDLDDGDLGGDLLAGDVGGDLAARFLDTSCAANRPRCFDWTRMADFARLSFLSLASCRSNVVSCTVGASASSASAAGAVGRLPRRRLRNST